jgi:hypothetical protein
LSDNGIRQYGKSGKCESSPVPRDGVPPEQRAAREARGRRSVEFGAAWFIGGLLVTVVTHGQAHGAGVHLVAWGPMLLGVHRIAFGLHLLRKSREPS